MRLPLGRECCVAILLSSIAYISLSEEAEWVQSASMGEDGKEYISVSFDQYSPILWAVSNTDHVIHVWNFRDKSLLRSIPIDGDPICTVFTGAKLIVGCKNGSIYAVNTSTMNAEKTAFRLSQGVFKISLSPKGSSFVASSVGPGGIAALFDGLPASVGDPKISYTSPADLLTAFISTQDKQLIAIENRESRANFDAIVRGIGHPSFNISFPGTYINDACVNYKSRSIYLLWGDRIGEVSLDQPKEPNSFVSLPEHVVGGRIIVSPSGDFVAISGVDIFIILSLWNKEIVFIDKTSRIGCVGMDVSHDSKICAVGGDTITLYEIK